MEISALTVQKQILLALVFGSNTTHLSRISFFIWQVTFTPKSSKKIWAMLAGKIESIARYYLKTRILINTFSRILDFCIKLCYIASRFLHKTLFAQIIHSKFFSFQHDEFQAFNMFFLCKNSILCRILEFCKKTLFALFHFKEKTWIQVISDVFLCKNSILCWILVLHKVMLYSFWISA